MAEERKSGVSFSFSKRKPAIKSYSSEKNALSIDEDKVKDDEKDYIHSAEEKELKSVKGENKQKEKVIPCLAKNRWILPPDSKFSNSLDRQAAEELMKDISEGDKADTENENVSIPLLLRNALPDVEGFDKDEKLDIAMRPDQSSMEDYQDMPVTSFGAAMLRGMGWKKGEAIGGTNKGLAEPIEYIPRSKGLGLGAERRPPADENRLGKKRKPGDTASSNMSGPIKEESGRVRHYKDVGEQVQQETSLDYRPGVAVIIEKGPHKNICGKIVAVDIDTSRITVQLHLSKENVAIHQCNARLLDDFEYKTLLSRKDNAKKKDSRTGKEQIRLKTDGENHTKEGHHEGSKYPKKDKDSSMSKSGNSNDHHRKKVKCWLFPQTRVRIISEDYEKGKYYNKKVQIVDVVSTERCVCQTDEGRFLEDIPQSALETVVPKTLDSYVRVVKGDHKGQLAVLLKRDKSEDSAVIQLTLDKKVVTVDFDDICEHIGDANEY
ncbi:G-patch domain and KOW motifs-containing protein-like isoform X1 [Porites lutea]|uniref:G-patch domain and KOW motifs-containing protein-like isoform X1 n=1 Tax=Porites lutea TaxID=51062 RepID=UPI003CC54C57